jgi:arylsulfatase A-like enzyme
MSEFISYCDGEPFPGVIGRTQADSVPAWPVPPRAPQGAPNILMIVLDDTGFAQIGCFGGLGGLIETPNIDRLADGGLRYNNFHTTALCTPTRASLLTGRNHHSVGTAVIMEFPNGYPGYNGYIPREAAMLPAILVERGYNTMCLGKWHMVPPEHATASGPYDRWPLGQGFERFYGFLMAETNQWEPELWYDNHRVDPPRSAEEGYHLSEDLADKAIEWISEQQAVTPSKPFFMYFAPGATHSPHHAPREWIDKYKGRFDDGWDVVRENTLRRQKEMGVVPESTVLPPRNPGVRAWDEISPDEKRVLTRQMEVFAAFLSHTDHHIGRVLDFMEHAGMMDNTVVIFLSDNGASGEGRAEGLVTEMSFFNFTPETLEFKLEKLDEWGGPSTHPHYATGWAGAGNTPNRWYKQMVHEGGVRDPLIVHWPALIKDRGAIRSQFHHVVDILPTLLETIGIDMPAQVRGYAQMPLEGESMAYSFSDAAAPTPRRVQYFEMLGHRALWADGWKLVTAHHSLIFRWSNSLMDIAAHDGDFDADQWELYHIDEDFSEVHDLAAQHPEKVRELLDRWWAEAGKYKVLPLDDAIVAHAVTDERPHVLEEREVYTYHHPVRLVRMGSPDLRNRSHDITAEVEIPPGGAEGVIVSNGGLDGGYSLCAKDGRLHYVSNWLSREHHVVTSREPLLEGEVTLRMEFRKTEDFAGTVALFIDGRKVGEGEIPHTNPMVYGFVEGLEVGSDSGSAVWPQYRPPFVFTGTIRKVEIKAVGPGHQDPEGDFRVAQYRQ